jgi:hypothetical protein
MGFFLNFMNSVRDGHCVTRLGHQTTEVHHWAKINCKYEDNIKMHRRDKRYEDKGWIFLSSV